MLSRRLVVPPALVLGAGVVLGLYAGEFLTANGNFGGPLALSTPMRVVVAACGGPLVLAALWLTSAALIRFFSTLSFAEALTADARSYWPFVIPGASLLLSLVARRPVTASYVAFSLVVCSTASLVCALKVLLVQPYVRKRWRVRFGHAGLPWMLLGGYALVMAWLLDHRYRAYRVWAIDLAHWDQGLWNTWHGRFLGFDHYSGLEFSLLTDHVEPINLLLAPLYLIWADPRVLLYAQLLGLVWGGWLVGRLTLRHLGSPVASLCMMAAYLAHPVIIGHALANEGPRTDLFTIPLFLALLLALERRRLREIVVFTVLVLSCKEYMGALVCLLGLYVIFQYGNRKLGLGLAAAGAAWTLVAVFVWLPWARGESGYIHVPVHFSHIGGQEGLAGIVRTVAADPLVLFERWSFRSTAEVVILLVSLACAPLGNVSLALVGLPVFGIFALTGLPIFYDLHLAPAFPFLIVASITGVGRFARWCGPKVGVPAGRIALSGVVCVMVASSSTALFRSNSPLDWSFWDPRSQLTYWRNHFVVSEHSRLADDIVSRLPAREPVIASDFLLSHVARRPRVFQFFDPPPDVPKAARFALIDLFEDQIEPQKVPLSQRTGARGATPGEGAHRPAGRELYGELLKGEAFGVREATDGVLFLERGLGNRGLRHDVRVVEAANPAFVVSRDLGNRLRLLGYDLEGFDQALPKGRRARIRYYFKVLEGVGEPFVLQYGPDRVNSVQKLEREFVLVDTLTPAHGEPLRLVHYASFVVLPSRGWEAGTTLAEEYDVVLPDRLEPGVYAWEVGLYVVPRYLGIRTTVDRLVPGTSRIPLRALHVEPAL